MCRTLFAQGSHDIAIGEDQCALAKRTGVSCIQRNSVPLNNAARRQQGLPEDPNEPRGAGYDDYLFDQMMQAMTGETDPAKQETVVERRMRKPFSGRSLYGGKVDQ
jgi:hypothetical protein